MKVIRSEHGIELIPETEFEKECLRLIANRAVTPVWTDSWNRSGNLKIEAKEPDWGT
jgi:hypothetical protein